MILLRRRGDGWAGGGGGLWGGRWGVFGYTRRCWEGLPLRLVREDVDVDALR